MHQIHQIIYCFSEIYYPYGWKLLVNGEKRDLMRVNYVLRGLELKKGDNIDRDGF